MAEPIFAAIIPTRATLLRQLQNYTPADAKEETDLAAMIAFLNMGGDCFARTHLPGHFTGSALLVNKDASRVLLNHHRALDFWMQFGGHADGHEDLQDVARREVQEESSFTHITPLQDAILDIDIHAIPYNAKRGEPAHLHYDVRYIFRLEGGDENFTISDESINLRWCDYQEALRLTGPGAVARLLSKWNKL